jgi:hypothetical protein
MWLPAPTPVTGSTVRRHLQHRESVQEILSMDLETGAMSVADAEQVPVLTAWGAVLVLSLVSFLVAVHSE